MHYSETKYGFEYGPASITRCCSDKKKGWVMLMLETARHAKSNAMQIYITKTGKVRVYSNRGEWRPTKRTSLNRK